MRQSVGGGRRQETAEGTVVSTIGPVIYASKTFGSPQLTGILNRFALTSGGVISLNGALQAGTAAIELVYHKNTLWHENSTNKWFYWNTTTAAYVQYLLTNIALSGTTYTTNAAAGTVIGTIAVTVSDGSLFINGQAPPLGSGTGLLSLGGPDAASFQIVGNQLQAAVTLSASSYSITITATPYVVGQLLTSAATAITGTVLNSISGVTLSSSTFAGGSVSGTVVGAITVNMSTGSFSGGTLALSGANASNFQLSSTTLPSNLETFGTDGSGTYNINIVPTLAGATGSGTAFPQTITGSSGSATPYTLTPFSSLSQTTGAVSPLGWPVDFFDDFNGTFTRVNFSGWTNRQSPNGFTTGATYGGSPAQYGCSIQAVWGGGYNGTDNVNNISMSNSSLVMQMTNIGGVVNTAAVNMTWPTCWGLWEWNVSCTTNSSGTNTGINLGLWMDPWNYWPNGVECDIQENAGGSGLHTTLHYGSTAKIQLVTGSAYPTGGVTDGNFHTYGCALTPAYFAVYIDGHLMGSTNSSSVLGGFTAGSMSTDPPTATQNPSFGFNLASVIGTPANIQQSGNLWLIIMGVEGFNMTAALCPVTAKMDWFRHSKMTPATNGPHV